jgi:hypothetical protein
MTRLTRRRPSPAFALAAIALFVALGGTGYAATQGSGRLAGTAKSKTSKPLTKGRVDQLIKQYVNSHLSSLIGPAGATGPAGTPGTPGTAGPAPIAVVGTGVSTTATPQTIATVGPWSVMLTCTGGGSPGASIAAVGPGEELVTTTIANTNGAAGSSYQSAGPPGGAAAVTPGSQISQVAFLSSGSTVYELKDNVRATTSGPDTDCTVLGDAIKIS